MKSALDLFRYSVIDHQAKKTLFLFHGTGGSERDLLFLDELIEPRFNLVGLRGNIDEAGMRRFFRRNSTGVFDQESISEESANVSAFISAWQQRHGLSPMDTVCLGYSNGANIILATVLRYPTGFRTAVLLHPMVPFTLAAGTVSLAQHRIFVSIGIHDQLVSSQQSKAVLTLLASQQNKPIIHEYPTGHELSDAELNDAVKFLESSG